MNALRKRIRGTRPVSKKVSDAVDSLGELVWRARHDIAAAILFEFLMTGLRGAGTVAAGSPVPTPRIRGTANVIPFPERRLR